MKGNMEKHRMKSNCGEIEQWNEEINVKVNKEIC